jgi:hypothetical protein
MKRKGPPAVKHLAPSQLKEEWKKLGRHAMRLWRASGGVDPEIDRLFKRMDAIDRTIGRLKTQLRLTVRRRATEA